LFIQYYWSSIQAIIELPQATIVSYCSNDHSVRTLDVRTALSPHFSEAWLYS